MATAGFVVVVEPAKTFGRAAHRAPVDAVGIEGSSSGANDGRKRLLLAAAVLASGSGSPAPTSLSATMSRSINWPKMAPTWGSASISSSDRSSRASMPPRRSVSSGAGSGPAWGRRDGRRARCRSRPSGAPGRGPLRLDVTRRAVRIVPVPAGIVVGADQLDHRSFGGRDGPVETMKEELHF
jgi:hypothetical protein